MSLPVLIGFAGVLIAAAATGMLAGRWVRRPRIDFIVWTAATLALTVALVAQSMGFGSGFNQGTFRAVQVGALLLAPLWIGWGLMELVAESEAVRFATRLLAGAVTVVASVILATDPLTSRTFGKGWPSASSYFQPVSTDAVDVVQALAVVAALAGVTLTVARGVKDPRGRPALAGVMLIAVAVLATAGMRFSLPDRAGYPLLSAVAAVLVWFGATRLRSVAGRASRSADPEAGGRDEQPSRDNGDRPADGGGPGDGKPHDDYDVANGDATAGGDHAEDGDVADGQYELYGQRGPLDPAGQRGAWDPGAQAPGGPNGRAYPADPLADGELAAAGLVPGAEGGVLRADGAPAAGAAGQSAGHGARPYGRILIFTLLDDRVDDFDRLAEQAAEAVMVSEPDTLVYVIHLVPNAPMQRIFYEIYRDRAAFDHHENQPYMQRFVADRRSCVLATNVIELRLKFAKVAPLPGPQAAAPVADQLPVQPPVQAAAGSALPAGQAAAGGAARPSGPLPRLQPLPPDPYLTPQGPRGPQGAQRFQPPAPVRAQYPAAPQYHDQPSYQGNGQAGSGQYPTQAPYPGGEYAGSAPYPQQRYPGEQPGDQPRTDPRATSAWRTAQHRPDPLRDPLRPDPLRPDSPRSDPQGNDALQGDPRRTDSWRASLPPDDRRRADPLQGDPWRGDPLQGDPRRTDSWRASLPPDDPRRGDPLQGDPRRTDSWRASPPPDGWRPGDRRTGEWQADESWPPRPQRPDQPDQPRPGPRRAPSAGRPNGSG